MTWIIVTMWPAINNLEMLTKLYNEWVRILRFNFPHYNIQSANKDIEIIHQAEESIWGKFQLLMDTSWPEIRSGFLQSPITYEEGETFKIFIDENKSESKSLFCDYPYLVQDLSVWSIIKVDAWLLEVEVTGKGEDYLIVKSRNSWVVGSKRHINLPWVHYKLPALAEKDIEDVLFAIQAKFDYIAMSFVRTKQDIADLRKILADNNDTNIKIIAKIENEEWVENTDDIIEVSDMVMVARWDLGTELAIESIPMHQMNIVKKCKLKNTPVIVATQILESMINNPIPTRAEVSDIFYAVIEWADMLMLSWETAIGKYPIQCVEIMKKVIEQAEKY